MTRRATNRLPLSAFVSLAAGVAKAGKAEAAGDDAKTVNELRKFAGLANDPTRVADPDARSTSVRGARAVIGALEGGQALPRASSGS